MALIDDIIARLRAGITIQLGDDVCPDGAVLDDAAEALARLHTASAECARKIIRWHQLVADGELSAHAALEVAFEDAQQLASICAEAA